jgi:uncharacterized damage-inducible protein DinB
MTVTRVGRASVSDRRFPERDSLGSKRRFVRVARVSAGDAEFPAGSSDDRELMLQWLRYLRGAVLRKASGLTDEQARWRPEDRLISIVGIVNHLTRLEWRWIDGAFRGAEVYRTEAEFTPDDELSIDAAVRAYRNRAAETDSVVLGLGIEQRSDPSGWAGGHDLRFVLLHLINETARHAGHADATRELLDGATGE